MKKKWPLILCITLISCFSLLLCGGAIYFFKNTLQPNADLFKNSATTSETKNPYSPGTIQQNEYTSYWLNLKYKPIDGMNFLLDEQRLSNYKNKLMNGIKSSGVFTDVNIELYLKSNSNSEDMDMDVLTIEKSIITEDALIKAWVNGINSSEQVKYSKQKLGDIEFTKVSNIKIQSKSCIMLLKKIDSHFVVLTFRNVSDEKANEILSGFSKLKE